MRENARRPAVLIGNLVAQAAESCDTELNDLYPATREA